MVGGDGVPGPPDPHGCGAHDPPVLQGHADEAFAVLQDERGDTGTAGERLSCATDDDGHRIAGAILGQQVPDGTACHWAQACGGTDHQCCGTAPGGRGSHTGPCPGEPCKDHAGDHMQVTCPRDSARAPPAAGELTGGGFPRAASPAGRVVAGYGQGAGKVWAGWWQGASKVKVEFGPAVGRAPPLPSPLLGSAEAITPGFPPDGTGDPPSGAPPACGYCPPVLCPHVAAGGGGQEQGRQGVHPPGNHSAHATTTGHACRAAHEGRVAGSCPPHCPQTLTPTHQVLPEDRQAKVAGQGGEEGPDAREHLSEAR